MKSKNYKIMKQKKIKKLIVNNRIFAYYDFDDSNPETLFLAVNLKGPDMKRLEDVCASCIAIIEQKNFKKLSYLNID